MNTGNLGMHSPVVNWESDQNGQEPECSSAFVTVRGPAERALTPVTVRGLTRTYTPAQRTN